jgi:EpsI family protein
VSEGVAAHTPDTSALTSSKLTPTPSGIVYLLVVVAVAATWPSWRALGQLWVESADYQHGFVVCAALLYWLVRLRPQIDTTPTRAVPAALPGLLLFLGCWIVAYRGNSESLQQVLLPVLLLAATVAALGWQIARVLLLPFASLYFAIPIWDQLVPLLQGLTTVVVEQALALLQVPTVVDGNHVTIPEGQFVIADACSGKRYLIAAIAFAVIGGAARGRPATRGAAVVAIAILFALLINWIRVAIIIYAGHVSNMEHYLVATDHLTFGWLLFIPLLGAVTLCIRHFGRDVPSTARIEQHPTTRVVYTAWLWAVALLGLPLTLTAADGDAALSIPALKELPVTTGAWQGPLPPNGQWHPQYRAVAAQHRSRYEGMGGSVDVYVNVYGAQRQDRELIWVHNTVAPDSEWSMRGAPASIDSPLALIVAQHATGSRWVIGQIYRVGGKITSTPALVQLYYGALAIWRPVPAGTVALASECIPDCDAAAERVLGFWRDQGPALTALIPTRL